MAGAQLPFFNPILDGWFQPQQTDRVGYRSAILAGAFRDGFLRQLKLVHQALEGSRGFNRIQVFALDVFHQRHFQRQLVGYLPHDRRDLLQACPLCGTPATLAGDQLKAVSDRPDDNRLNDAAGLNRACQFVQRFFAKPGARLVRARLNQIDIDFLRAACRLAGRSGGSSAGGRNRVRELVCRSAGADGSGSRMSAPSPRPKAFLGIGNYLLGELRVAFRPFTVYVIENNRLTKTWRFGKPHIARYYALKDLRAEKAAQIGRNLSR